MQQKGILYHVSLLQYYDYCVQLYIHHYLLYLFFYLLNFIRSLDFALAAKFLLVWHVINITVCSV